MKYATALRLGTAAAADILRRFTRSNLQHPTYRALVELGKALRMTFVCRYLHRMELRREIHEGLNVVENWNSANDFILYGVAARSPPTGWRTRRRPCCPCTCCRTARST